MSIPPGPIGLFADPIRIEQIVCNLLTNAVKYTDPGGRIEVTSAVDTGTTFTVYLPIRR